MECAAQEGKCFSWDILRNIEFLLKEKKGAALAS
jgi:hypothetical protein